MTHRPRIFVQIAAYRDPELLPTLRDCVSRAAHPERLSFGICWQKDESESIGEFANDDRVRVVTIEWYRSRGLGWARSVCQQLWRGEDYTLQLDAHHRFADSWDDTLIAMHRQVGGGRTILSTYAGSYEPGDDAGAAARSPVPSKITAGEFRDYGTIVLVPVLIEDYEQLTAPLRARFVCGHFYFTSGMHCVEYRYDPDLYFLGDELSLSVRSWCLGYDLYHPHRQVVYHYFRRDGAHRPWFETSVPDGAEIARWGEREQAGLRRLRQMLGMERPTEDLGKFGLSRRRALAAYERYAGIDFARRAISPEAHTGIEPVPG